MSNATAGHAARRVCSGAAALLVIVALYLPMLAARFDFNDDGDLVYPRGGATIGDQLRHTWARVAANYDHMGVFRPALFAHWDAQAALLGGEPLRWRSFRLAWMGLATAALLWLLAELRLAWPVALLVAASIMWMPGPNEVWRVLTLSEGVAMPYAFAALACAVRGGRSRQPLGWDLAAVAAALVALGCKNTFLALVPVQFLLRVAPDGEPLLAALRARGARASLLLASALMPVAHFAFYLHDWRPGQYAAGLPTTSQLRNMRSVVFGCAGLGLLLPSLLVGVAAVAAARGGLRAALTAVWAGQRAACRAGVVLLAGGIAVYLPVHIPAGYRYAIPAVWGGALLAAALLNSLWRLRSQRAARVAIGLWVGALAAFAVDNLLAQQHVIANATPLWQALRIVEREAAPGAAVGVRTLSGEIGLGIHFFWHLRGRGRGDLDGRLFDERDTPLLRPELSPPGAAPLDWLVSTVPGPPPGDGWRPRRACSAAYDFGRRRADAWVWQRSGAPAAVIEEPPRAAD